MRCSNIRLFLEASISSFRIFAFAFIFFSGPKILADVNICPHVILREGKLNLNSNEKILVCGSNKSDLAWRDVPLSQAQYVLRSFLQNRGYLSPRFEIENETLNVYSGDLTLIQILEANHVDKLLYPEKKRKVIGYSLEPKRLDEIEQWADLTLRRKGYACPVIDINAQAWDRKVIVNVNPGLQGTIAIIERVGYEGLDQEALVRFEAFHQGEIYNVVDTKITAQRLLSDGIFQNAYVTTNCREDKVELRITVDKGKARLFRFGIGASTEEFPFSDIWFKNTLLDNRASNYTASLHLSPILQRFNLTSEFYIFDKSPLYYLGPRLEVERHVENAYNLEKTQIGIDLGRLWDQMNVRWDGRVGPTLNKERTLRGEGPGDTSYLTWVASLNTMSHAYEAFARDQYEGWTAGFKYSGQRIGVGSNLNIDRYDLNFKYLWNVGNYSPPAIIYAAKVGATAVSSNLISSADRNALPVSYRIYYGGDENLRGFTRQSLNNGGFGYLSAFYLGNELRLIEQLPYRLEPFLLGDVGKLGQTSTTLDKPIFTSLGLGMRWPSPFGTFRVSAAHGKIYDETSTTASYEQDWVYFLSFGQEF